MIGRSLPRKHLALHMGQFGCCPLHWPFRRRISMVCAARIFVFKQHLTASKGNLDYWSIHSRWWCQGTQDKDEELDLHHFL